MKERLRGCICTSFCFLLWIAALGGFTANASDETAVFSSSYQNMSDVYDGNWIISKDDSLYSVYTQEGGLKFENKQGVPFLPDGTQNGTSNVHATMQLEGVLAESDTYGTRLTTDGMSGKYALEYTLQHRITTQRATKTYVTFGLGRRQDGSATMSGAWLQMRIYPNNVNVVRTVDGVRQDLTNIAPTALVNDQEWTLRVEFDTQQKLYTISINGEVCPKAVNIPFQGTAADFVPDIYFYMMDANDTGCYFWIKNIKLYAIDANEADARYVSGMGRMGQLPNTLVPDYTAVTSSFTVPEVNGVTWSSSNEELVGVDGTVTRWYDDQTVVLTAAATADNGSGRSFCYKKAYTLHVPALESASSTVRMDDTWSSAQDLGGWLFKGEGDVIPAAGSDGLRLAKSASAAEDEKAYAYLGLYGTEPGGESGKTALYSAGHRGVYDVSFEITPVFGAGQPYAVAAGYLQGDRFYSCGSLEFSQSGLYLSYASGVESLERERLANVQSGQCCSLTMRIDTEAQKLWILLDGQVCTTARTFYCALPEGASFALNALQVTINAGADPGDCITVHCAELTEYEREQPFTGAAVTAAAGLTCEQVAACVTTPARRRQRPARCSFGRLYGYLDV